MKIKNKSLISGFIAICCIQATFADVNKDYLLGEISSLETQFTKLKESSSTSLENQVYNLSEKYDSIFKTLGYDSKTIAYLVGLGKLNSNFKEDLSNDFNTLSKEIIDKTAIEVSSLTSLKNNLKINYSTVSDAEKKSFQSTLDNLNSNYTNLSGTFSGKITTLANKYTSSLTDYQNQVKTAYTGNTASLTALQTFGNNYDALYSLYEKFEKNYNEFKQSYLSFAGDLTLFSETQQKYYVDSLKKELEKIRDGNIAANPSLASYTNDIDRLIELLLQNFENSLVLQINNSYGVIYSDDDINDLISKFNTVKNKYYDLEGKLKPQEVLTNTGALEEVNFIQQKLGDINTKITTLIGTGGTSNTYENVKIRLDNEMVKFYNENYKGYREDLLTRLKEKLNIVSLETKNILLAADTIDLRYNILSDRISKSNDFVYINEQVATFKKEIAKYSYLNSDVLNTKIKNLQTNLDIFYINKELAQFKYVKLSQESYNTQLQKIFAQLKTKYPDTYKLKLQQLLERIDVFLTNDSLTTKTRFMLLVVKLNIVNTLK